MTTTGVARAVDAHGRARFGTRIRVPGCEEEEELVVFAWEDGPLFDGAPLREVRSSSAYGIKVYQAEGSTKEALACPPETMTSPPRTSAAPTGTSPNCSPSRASIKARCMKATSCLEKSALIAAHRDKSPAAAC